MPEINKYTENDKNEVINLILHCQNDGTRPVVSIKNQPELLNIAEKYINNGGNFWTAKHNNKVVGCIGLMKYDNSIAILKKFFVHESFRGAPYYTGQKLYKTLLEFAKEQGFDKLILDTPKNTARAHDFYIKNGFKQIDKQHYPAEYPSPYEDNDYFYLDI